MPDISGQPQFEKKQIEQDIERLSRELVEKQRQLTSAETRKEHKEVLHQVIGERIQQGPPCQAAAGTGASSLVVDDDEDKELPEYLKNVSPEIRKEVHLLIHLAFNGGIEKAASAAKKHGSFILDAFHDALVDKLYNELKSRGLLK